MWDLIWLSLAVLAGLCIDIIIPTFCSLVIISIYYTFISKSDPNQDKYVTIKCSILIVIMFLVMWEFDFFPGRELTLFLIP